MSILNNIKKWVNTKKRSYDPVPPILKEPGERNVHGEQEEVWQWQIDCMGSEWPRHKPMPKNFGLMVGTSSEVEAQLKSQVSFKNYFETEVRDSYRFRLYIFRNPELEYGPSEGSGTDHPVQKGAIRCVSKDMKLIRDDWRPNAPFMIEMRVTGGEFNDKFEFHPIRIFDEKFIKGER